MTVLLITALVFAILFSLKRNKYGVLFIIFITPFAFQIRMFSDYSFISKTWHNILVVILFFLLMAKYSLVKGRIKLNKLDWLIIVTLCYGISQVVMNYLSTGDWNIGIQGFRVYYAGTLFYFVVRDCIKRENIEQFVNVLLTIVFIVAMEVIVENILIVCGANMEILPWVRQYNYGHDRMYRPYGIFYQIQFTATFVLIGAFVILPLFFERAVTYKKMRGILSHTSFLSIVIFISLIFSTSRIVIIIFFSVFVYYFMYIKKMQNISKLLPLLFIPPIMIAVLGYDMFQFVFVGTAKGEDISYSMGWMSVLPFIENVKDFSFANLLVGHGYTFDLFDTADITEMYTMPGGTEVHFLNFIYETGLLGCVLFILLNIFAYRIAMKTANNEKKLMHKDIIKGMAFVPIGVLATTLHYMPLGHAGIHYIYYAILGIISSVYRQQMLLTTNMK